MLIEFKTKNYKSFAEEVSFSMLANPKHKNQMDYSLFEKKSGRHKLKVLCSSVVYGANASGKSNIIGAMDTLRSIVLRGDIKNLQERKSNAASSLLELIPNNTCKVSEPVEFFIDFLEEDYRIQYKLIIDLGKFLEVNYNRRIIFEELTINNKNIFTRQLDTIKFNDISFSDNYEGMTLAKNYSLTIRNFFCQEDLNISFQESFQTLF